MDGGEPAGGQWNFDHDNREPPPKGADTLGVTEPWWPTEDDIDAEVRDDLDRWERDGDVTFLGRDGERRFAATRREALAALDHFVEHRLPEFGAHEDAILEGDPWMAHSLISAPMNLGLLDPLEVVERAETAYRSGAAPIASVEGFVRQVIGWRDYVWHLYWHQGDDYRRENALRATEKMPQWFAELDADATDARCLSHTLDQVAEHGWVHHIPRLMVLGSYALQRGWAPTQVTDWFHRAFVDGYDWVMVPNVVGMSQHADGGVMATKPYTSGGAYINTMSDHCGSCRFDPKVRVGDDACPFTAGYWWFLDRHRETFAGNHRMSRAVQRARPPQGPRRTGRAGGPRAATAHPERLTLSRESIRSRTRSSTRSASGASCSPADVGDASISSTSGGGVAPADRAVATITRAAATAGARRSVITDSKVAGCPARRPAPPRPRVRRRRSGSG